MIYQYDGSFFGYLSAVFDAWHDGLDQVDDIRCHDTGSLFSPVKQVCQDEGKAARILESLRTKCGAKAAHFLYYGFLAEEPQRERKLLAYLQLAFRLQGQFGAHLSDPVLWEVRKWAQKTGNERHKLLGLARYQELDGGMLYCRLAPTCCVVPLMAPHFIRRLSGEEWVLHDTRRQLGVYYRQGEAMIVEIPQTLADIAVSADEQQFASLWKRYYDTIAIAERHNERLRMQYMPKKYWQYLTEMTE